MVVRVCSYTCPFIRANQAIKALGKLDQAIKQASGNESRDQEGILAIKTFDRRRRWKYGVHSGDYPLLFSTHTSVITPISTGALIKTRVYGIT